jgi:UDP-N-acetyl-D-mannosaminuronic acid dehydrogenase
LWPRFWQRRLALQGAGVQELRRLPQLVAGLSEACVTAVRDVFSFAECILEAPSLESAELAKLLNNAFRDVSFAFANMAAKVMSGLGLDIPATMALANTGYPRNPIAMPGPGVGGSCLRKDTRMLAGVAEALAVDAELLDAARCLNDSMPQFVAEQVSSEAAANGLAPDRTRVLVCGMAFKGDPQTADMERESTGLRSRGCWSTGECQCASMTRSCRPRQ